ncbi:MAG: hypothetical protein AAF547_22805 [Actinomycetota bacterium]
MTTEDEEATQQETAFFITRIGHPGSPVRQRTDDMQKYVIGPPLAKRGIRLVRADLDPTPGRISDRIVVGIDDARVVIADVSGLTANVFYELGIAHARVKPVILLVDDAETIPFDTVDQNHIIIGDDGKLGAAEAEAACGLFDRALNAVLAEDFEPSSPVTAANLRKQVQAIEDPQARQVARLRKEVYDFREELARLSNLHSSPPREVRFSMVRKRGLLVFVTPMGETVDEVRLDSPRLPNEIDEALYRNLADLSQAALGRLARQAVQFAEAIPAEGDSMEFPSGRVRRRGAGVI